MLMMMYGFSLIYFMIYTQLIMRYQTVKEQRQSMRVLENRLGTLDAHFRFTLLG